MKRTISTKLNSLLYPYKESDISLFNKRINHRLNKYTLQKLDEENKKLSSNSELHGKDYHIELIKRTLNPYLYDIIPKIGKNKEISYVSQDPKVNNCLLIKVQNYASIDNVAIACLSNRENTMCIDKIYIARMFRRSPNLELNIMKGLSKYIFFRYLHATVISITLNPDIYSNIIDVLLDIGYGISTEMENKTLAKIKESSSNSNLKSNSQSKIVNVSDISKFIESKSVFLNKPLFEIEKNNNYNDKLIFLRLYRREFNKGAPNLKKIIPTSRKLSNNISIKKAEAFYRQKENRNENISTIKERKSNIPRKSEEVKLPNIISSKSTERDFNWSAKHEKKKSLQNESHRMYNNYSKNLRNEISMMSENITKSRRELEKMQKLNLKSNSSMRSPTSIKSIDEPQGSRIYWGIQDSFGLHRNSNSINDMKSSGESEYNFDFNNSPPVIIPNIKANYLEEMKYKSPSSIHSYADQFYNSIVSANQKKNFIDSNKKIVKKIQFLKAVGKDFDRLSK